MYSSLEEPPSYENRDSEQYLLPNYDEAMRIKNEELNLIKSEREERKFLQRHKPPGTSERLTILSLKKYLDLI